MTLVACSPIPLTGDSAIFFAPSAVLVLASCFVRSSAARFAPLPRAWSESKRVKPTSSQRYCEPLTPLSSRPFQEQPARAEVSLDVVSEPALLLALGTSEVIVFVEIALHGSGSSANFAERDRRHRLLRARSGGGRGVRLLLAAGVRRAAGDDEHHRDGGAGEYAGESRG